MDGAKVPSHHCTRRSVPILKIQSGIRVLFFFSRSQQGKLFDPYSVPLPPSLPLDLQIMGVLAKRVFPQAWDLPLHGLPAPTATTPSPSTTPVPMVPAMEEEEKGTDAPPPRVFHASIAQCYDKKLEASRKDFRHDDLDGQAEVDLVLTTAEVLELIEERAAAAVDGNASASANTNNHGNDSDKTTTHTDANNETSAAMTNTTTATAAGSGTNVASGGKAPPSDDFTFEVPSAAVQPPALPPADAAGDFFRSHPPCDLSIPIAPGFPSGQVAVSEDGLSLYGGVDGEGAAGGGSGGYLEHVFRYAALRLFGVDLSGRPLVYREGRNADFRETSLEVSWEGFTPLGRGR